MTDNTGVMIAVTLLAMLLAVQFMAVAANAGIDYAPREATNHALTVTAEFDGGVVQRTYDVANPDGTFTTHTERTARP